MRLDWPECLGVGVWAHSLSLGFSTRIKGISKTGGVEGRLEHALRLGLNPVFTKLCALGEPCAPLGGRVLLVKLAGSQLLLQLRADR